MAYKKKKPSHRKNPKRVAAGKKAAAARRKGYSKRRRSARMDGARCMACGHVAYGVGGRAPSNAKLKAHYKRKHPHATYGWTAGLTAAQHKKHMKHRAKYSKRRGSGGYGATRARLEKAFNAAYERYNDAFHREMLLMGKNPGHAMLMSEITAVRERPRVYPLWLKSKAAYTKLREFGHSY